MVGITYTGVDGKRTQFGSTSAASAMARLKSIKGYNGTVMDSAAAALAGAFAARHKNASRVSGVSNKANLSAVGGNNVFAGRNGVVSRLPSLAGIAVEGGKPVVRTQDRFVREDGSVSGVGKQRTTSLEGVATTIDVEKRVSKAIEDAMDSIKSEKVGVDEEKKNVTQVSFVESISFDTSSGPLRIAVKMATMNVPIVGEMREFSTSQTIGEGVMVHESRDIDRHSYVYVLSRQANVSSKEAKTSN